MIRWRIANLKGAPTCRMALACDLEEYLPAVAYIVEILLEDAVQWAGEWTQEQPSADMRVLYTRQACGPANQPTLWIVPDDRLWGNYGRPASLPPGPLSYVDNAPLLYGKPAIERSGNTLRVESDILASGFFLVTRYEEVIRRDVRDEHGRFLGRESLPFRHGFLNRPVVEEYAEILRRWLRLMGWDTPNRMRRFSVLLTHDVDVLWKHGDPCAAIVDALHGERPLGHVLQSLVSTAGLKKDPFDTFDFMISRDRSVHGGDGLQAQSVYFFMSGKRGRHGICYDINGWLARKTLAKVRGSGAAVGYHTSYEAGERPDLIGEEKARLERVCGFTIRRNRCHFLAWREVGDGWFLVRAGLDWDATLGYADVAGFRLGVCHPIPLFDPVRLRLFGIEEHPLIVMDCTLSDARYMALSEEEAFECCAKLLAQTRKHGGEWVMLWHNTVFAPKAGNYHPRLYERLMRHLCE